MPRLQPGQQISHRRSDKNAASPPPRSRMMYSSRCAGPTARSRARASSCSGAPAAS